MVSATIGDSVMANEVAAATYRVEEAAKLLGISRNSAYEAARTGQLPTVRIGKRLVVPKVALDKLLNGTA